MSIIPETITPKQLADEVADIFAWVKANRAVAPALEPRQPAVYFVRCGEFIKIGWSVKWPNRINGIQVNNPCPIEILLILGRPQIFEKTMHRQFAAAHHRGEWFKDCPEIREYIESRKDECWYRAGRKK